MEITDIQVYLDQLSQKQKDKLLISLLKKNKGEIDKIYFKHVAEQSAYEDLLEGTKNAISKAIQKAVDQAQWDIPSALVKGLTDCNKHIIAFVKLDKRPEKEAEIILYLLNIIFKNFSNELGTYCTSFDFKVAQKLTKLINLVEKKMHEDYRVEYVDKINNFLFRLKTTSDFIDYIYDMPERLS